SDGLYFSLSMKKTPLTVAGFIISPVYRMGSISLSGQPLSINDLKRVAAQMRLVS
ncbi:MAG: hypothetical protein K0Q73_111, partial [Paenibacillus sp.]|nr:hypothetical protein [Paenibacillus sp.]